MENKDGVYKSFTRKSKLPSCMLDLVYFQKLYKKLKEINDRAIEIEKAALQRKPDQSEEDFKKLQDRVTDLYKLGISIKGSKDEFIGAENPGIFCEDSMPDSVTSIMFDNSFQYRYTLGRDPLNHFKVVFDFSRPNIFDFSAFPTESTPNFSIVEVNGQDQTWVEGAYSAVMSSLDDRRKGSSWVHRSRIYDIFLWLFILPSSFWFLRKIEFSFGHHFANLSPVWQVAFYLYFFISFVWFFVMLFKYGRWLYPYLELKTSHPRGATLQRAIFYLLLGSVVSSFLYDFIKYLATHLKPF